MWVAPYAKKPSNVIWSQRSKLHAASSWLLTVQQITGLLSRNSATNGLSRSRML